MSSLRFHLLKLYPGIDLWTSVGCNSSSTVFNMFLLHGYAATYRNANDYNRCDVYCSAISFTALCADSDWG